MKKVIVTSEEFKALEEEFSNWFDYSSGVYNLFKDSRGTCKGIIMEYLANKEGKTIYICIANEKTKEN